jgi:dethiobiotin synthetase
VRAVSWIWNRSARDRKREEEAHPVSPAAPDAASLALTDTPSPGSADPNAPHPAAPQPDTTEPAAAEPDNAEPDNAQSGAAQSGAAQSGAAQSGAAQSGAAQSGAAQSGAAQSGAAQSGAAQSGAAEAGGTRTRAAEPGAAQSDATRPGNQQAAVPEPGVAKPGIAEPGVAKPGIAEPGVAEPGAAESGAPPPGDRDAAAAKPAASRARDPRSALPGVSGRDGPLADDQPPGSSTPTNVTSSRTPLDEPDAQAAASAPAPSRQPTPSIPVSPDDADLTPAAETGPHRATVAAEPTADRATATARPETGPEPGSQPATRPARPVEAGEWRGIVLITGTDTDVGKTIVTAAIAAAAQAAGLRVAVVKPGQTGTVLGGPTDIDLVNRLAHPLTTRTLASYPEPLAPLAAARVAGMAPLELYEVVDAIRAEADKHDLVLVEGAGGLLVPMGVRPSGEAWTVADLATTLGGQTVVVARAGLGTLNHTALTLEALERRGVPAKVVLGAWPAEPELVHWANLTEFVPHLVGALPDGAGRMEPGVFQRSAPGWLTPALYGVLDDWRVWADEVS